MNEAVPRSYWTRGWRIYKIWMGLKKRWRWPGVEHGVVVRPWAWGRKEGFHEQNPTPYPWREDAEANS